MDGTELKYVALVLADEKKAILQGTPIVRLINRPVFILDGGYLSSQMIRLQYKSDQSEIAGTSRNQRPLVSDNLS